jgi:hypothetical protein
VGWSYTFQSLFGELADLPSSLFHPLVFKHAGFCLR